MKQEIKERIAMIQRGEVPEGYKKTEVGIIPDNWDVKTMGELGEFFRGKGIPKSSIQEKGLSCITYGQIYTNYNFTARKFNTFISRETAKGSIPIRKNDILFASSGETLNEIGKCIAYLGDDEAYAGGDIVIFRPYSYESELLGYLLNQEVVNRQKYRLGQGHSVVHIYAQQLATLIIPDASSFEQKKIAQILSTWDKAIELKSQLIDEKKERKKGLMQRLLTGRVRLPGFDGGWEEVKLGDILKERNERDFSDLELLAITAGKGIVRRDELNQKDTSSGDKSKYKRIMPLDIGYNTMRMWQGVSGVSEYEGIISPAYTILVPRDEIDSYFMGYLFKLPMIINLFYRFSQGLVNDTLNLKYNNLKKIKVIIPKSYLEQQAIANTLSTADHEIELLERELELLKEQKKGLMQLLLTGIVRVEEVAV